MKIGDKMQRESIDKIAKNTEDRLLLAKLWDKIDGSIRKNIIGFTPFLSPREQEMSGFLFGDVPGLHAFGGYGDAERKMLIYLPEYLEEEYLLSEESPVVALEASFFQGDSLSHRDFLGALMGAGISRETVGDICVEPGRCVFFVTQGIAPYILDNLNSAGRTKLHLQRLELEGIRLPQPEFQSIRDTLSSLRLDSVVSSGFRIGRSLAAEYIRSGKACLNGIPCEKPDKEIHDGDKISVRGLGKIRLAQIGGKTKKDRISIVIQKYV